MIKHTKFSKIGQFRQVVTSINKMVNYVGRDENDEPIYDPSIKKPVLTFKGTVKLHGTNSSVCYNDGDFWTQSKEQVLSLEEDNYGFCKYVMENQEIFQNLLNRVIERFNVNTKIFTVAIFGEWMGAGIQKGMGISKMDKTFVIFAIKIDNPHDENFKSLWVDSTWLNDNENNIYNIDDFESHEIDIDFNMPQLAQNKLVDYMLKVEEQCPVAKHFGHEGKGEGMVWRTTYKDNDFKFKVKGEKHSSSKVKTLAKVDTEKLNSINEFVEYAATENRFKQAMEIIFKGNEIDIKKLGDVLRWVIKDITEEEADTMEDNGLTSKDVNKYLSTKIRNMFFEEYNKF